MRRIALFGGMAFWGTVQARKYERYTDDDDDDDDDDDFSYHSTSS